MEEVKKLKKKWNKQYHTVVSSWENNWTKLSTYFKYPAGIRKLIYTTNSIKGYYRQIRKVTKNKGILTSETVLLKLIYLATERIAFKWTMSLTNWVISAKDYHWQQNENGFMILSRKKEAVPCSLNGADTASFKLDQNNI